MDLFGWVKRILTQKTDDDQDESDGNPPAEVMPDQDPEKQDQDPEKQDEVMPDQDPEKHVEESPQTFTVRTADLSILTVEQREKLFQDVSRLICSNHLINYGSRSIASSGPFYSNENLVKLILNQPQLLTSDDCQIVWDKLMSLGTKLSSSPIRCSQHPGKPFDPSSSESPSPSLIATVIPTYRYSGCYGVTGMSGPIGPTGATGSPSQTTRASVPVPSSKPAIRTVYDSSQSVHDMKISSDVRELIKKMVKIQGLKN